MRKINTVTVTGAAGTVGGYVVRELLEKKYAVIAVDRPGTLRHLREVVKEKSLMVREMDLCDEKRAGNALYGSDAFLISNADAVINLAADLDITKPYSSLKSINVDAPVNLFKELITLRGKVFIHFSSGSVYADCGPYELHEDSPVEGKSGYEISKIISEECLKVLAGYLNAPKLIIIRPSLIYGRGGRFLAAGVMALPPILGFLFGEKVPRIHGGPKVNLIHAEDVARAAVFLLENEEKIKSGEVFNVADDMPVGFGEVFDAAVEAYGLKRVFPLPLPSPVFMAPFKHLIDTELFFKIFDAPIDLLWWAIRKKYGIKSNFNARFEKEMAAYFTKDTIFSNDKIKRLGFSLKYPTVKEGMKNVVEWYRMRNWIPKEVKPFWKVRER